MRRRELLRAGAGGGLALGLAKALHNTTVGYGHFGLGENLRTQDLAAVARDRFRQPRRFAIDIDQYRIELADGDRLLRTPNGEAVPWNTGNVPDSVATFRKGVEALAADRVRFEFHGTEAFFDRLAAARQRPRLVDLVRGWQDRRTDPETVAAFAGADPRDPGALLEGLVRGFRAETHYDAARYIAGSIEDNLVPGKPGLRDPLTPTVGFDPILAESGSVGLFCGEFVRLSMRAIQSVDPLEQSPPLIGAYVRDRRHKHAFTGVASVVGDGEDLLVPMTFVDYTDTTRYGDYRLDGVLGAGVDAYDTWHRADVIRW